MIERSDVWCTNCSRQFIAELDMALDGNHEITCPLCSHIHYRVVRNGVVTEERWRSSAGQQIFVATTYVSNIQINYTINVTSSAFTNDLWLNRSDIILTT